MQIICTFTGFQQIICGLHAGKHSNIKINSSWYKTQGFPLLKMTNRDLITKYDNDKKKLFCIALFTDFYTMQEKNSVIFVEKLTFLDFNISDIHYKIIQLKN